jgi:hypothetical protein
MEVRIILYPMVVCNDLKKNERNTVREVLRVKTRNKEQGVPLFDKQGTRCSLVLKGAVYIMSSAPECIFNLNRRF